MSKAFCVVVFLASVATGYAQRDDVVLTRQEGYQLLYAGPNDSYLYSFEMIAGKKDTSSPKTASPGIRKNDAFSRLMAGVVNDTAILYDTYVDIEPVKDTVKTALVKKPVVKTDSPVAVMKGKKTGPDTLKKATAIYVPQKKKDSVQIKTQVASVQKFFEHKTDSALELIYVAISTNGKADTINLAIAFAAVPDVVKPPADTAKKMSAIVATRSEQGKEPAKDTTGIAVKKPEKINAPVTTIPQVADSASKNAEAAQKKTAPEIIAVNTNCKNSASDYDVDKLRVKMLAVDSDDDKLIVARKLFRIKCFTTKQVKALSEVFPTDEGRYKLFDTAYPFVSDYGNFPQLAGLLTGQYYINRFKAMLRQ